MKGLAIAIETSPGATTWRGISQFDSDELQTRFTPRPIMAAAMLSFEIDAQGICCDFALHALDRRMAGESALVLALERKLCKLETEGGRLVTCDGHHQLQILRIAAMRHRHFAFGGAVGWLRDLRDCHEDVTLMIAPAGGIDVMQIRKLSMHLSGRSERGLSVPNGPARREQGIAELQTIRAMIVYFHLLSERHRSIEPLARGVSAMSDMLRSKARTAPHLLSILTTSIFRIFAAEVF